MNGKDSKVLNQQGNRQLGFVNKTCNFLQISF